MKKVPSLWIPQTLKGNKEILVPVLKEIVLDINIEDALITIKPSGEWMDED